VRDDGQGGISEILGHVTVSDQPSSSSKVPVTFPLTSRLRLVLMASSLVHQGRLPLAIFVDLIPRKPPFPPPFSNPKPASFVAPQKCFSASSNLNVWSLLQAWKSAPPMPRRITLEPHSAGTLLAISSEYVSTPPDLLSFQRHHRTLSIKRGLRISLVSAFFFFFSFAAPTALSSARSDEFYDKDFERGGSSSCFSSFLWF